ncbi:hypothetical protein BH23ACT2_BH23ACT2_01910 [soil metagenome]
MSEVLLPRTDVGVLAQVVAVVAITASALWMLRGSRDAVHLVLGLFLVTMAFFGLRTLH